MTKRDEQDIASTSPAGSGSPPAPPPTNRDTPAAAWRRLMEATTDDEREERMAAFIDSLHHHPGEPIPAWWAVCPLCSGLGCPACDATGRMHAKRAKWVDDQLPYAWDAFERFVALVEHTGTRVPRVEGAVLILGRKMDALLDEWVAEDPALAAVLAEVDAARRGRSPDTLEEPVV